MRKILHISDLHFGRTDPVVIGPLTAFAAQLEPDVVVVSGDLTQRARNTQFAEARRFLDTLPRPQIIVPGNHDVPLYDVFNRFVRPLVRYRKYITDDLEPAFVDDEIAVLGLNSARSLTFKGGRINTGQIERLRERLCALDDRVVKIVVSHHPFDLPVGHDPADIVGRAAHAMQMFAECGVDMLLAGHVHLGSMGSTADRYRIGDYAAIVVQAGTAVSTRHRGETNSFNVIRVASRTITVEHYAWSLDDGTFRRGAYETFPRTAKTRARHRPSPGR